MDSVVYILISLVLSATTGESRLTETFVSGPYRDIAACSSAQHSKGIQKPQDGVVTVYLCRRIETESIERPT